MVKLINRFKNSNNTYLFICITVAVLILYGIFLFQDKPFFLLNDQQVQYNLFYTEWIRLLKNFISTGEWPFYSWFKFLGSDYYSSAAYYVTGDPFVLILMFLPNLEKGLLIESILLVYVSAFLFKLYLVNFGFKKDRTLLYSSMAYALSGIAIIYSGNYMFHRFYALLPLLFIGIERAIHHNKYKILVLSSAVLILQNYYLFVPISLFLVPYSIFTFLLKSEQSGIKLIFIKSVKLISAYLMGLLLVSFFWLPVGMYIIGNPRLGQISTTGLFWELRVWIGLFFNSLMGPFPQYSGLDYPFYSGFTGHASWYSLYFGSFAVLLFLNLILNLKKEKNIYYLVLWLTSFLIVLFLPVNSLFHGFSEPSLRLVLLMVIPSILIISKELEKDSGSLNLKVYFGYIITGILITLIFIFINQENISHYRWVFLNLIISVVLTLVLYTLFIKKKYGLFVIISCIEFSIVGAVSFYFFNHEFYRYEPNLTAEYVEYYQEIDENAFYRLYIDPSRYLPSMSVNLNQSLEYRYHSLSTYDTLYESSLTPFLRLNEIEWHIINIKDPILFRFLGVKYVAVYSEDELPVGNFHYVYDLDYLKVYENDDFSGNGFTYSSFEIIDNIKSFNQWNEIALVSMKDYNLIEDIDVSPQQSFTITEKTNNSFYGEITLENKQLLYISVPYNAGWSVFDQGKELEIINVNGGFIGVVLESGNHQLQFSFMPVGFKWGVYISLVSSFILLIYYLYKRFTNNI